MFTGLVQARAKVVSIEPSEAGGQLRVERPDLGAAVQRGDSICVSGCCLSVTQVAPEGLGFDVIHETLAKTNLGALKPGQEVNLEPAVTANQPMGGHFMQGHVDGVGEVVDVDQCDGQCRVTIRPPAQVLEYITPKGSIAIDGVSLTLASVKDETFDVALIPETLQRTTLGGIEPGAAVNLEADMLAKTVIHWLQRRDASGPGGTGGPGGVTMAFLERAGFVTAAR